MKALLNFLIKYHVFFLFLLLELISLTFIFRYNNFHRVNFLNSSNVVSGKVYEEYSSVLEYFSLRKLNDQLSTENARLRAELQSLMMADLNETLELKNNNNSVRAIAARVINNSVNKQYNYLTLNKGAADGIQPDMGVINHQGVVGVIINVSENYSTALSVLNGRWSINAKLQSTNYFGPLHWEGKDPALAVLDEIPYHVKVAVGEQVVSSGFSAIFPEGVPIGEVIEISSSEGDTFQKIKVQLSTDFRNLFYVEIIEKINKEEQIELEKITSDE